MKLLYIAIVLIYFTIIEASPLLIPVAETGQESITIVDEQYRLPKHLRPVDYKVELRLENNFFETKSFTGRTVFTFQPIVNDLNKIILHSKDLTYNLNEIYLVEESNNTNISLNSISVEKNDYDFMTINTNVGLSSGNKYILTFESYTGILGDDMHGFYLSSYQNADNQTEYIATTQFQPTHARRAFPCLDEPSFKAIFKISITHPSDYIAIANTPVIKNQPRVEEDGYVVNKFKATPQMSTYLIAFVVSKFGNWETVDQTYRVFARKEANATIEYSFKVGQELLKSLETFTGLEYLNLGIEKLDQVAIPDFSAGAMENWGLITYRETALLWDKDGSTNRNKQRVATVIAHEMSHLWFGDLVTTEWWSNTWLNEGFATYFEYHTTAEVEKTWEMEKQFVVEQQQSVFAVDALTNTLPIYSDVATPSEIQNKFTSISYNKGGSVIRMLKYFIGENKFKTALQKYLQDNSYKNTLPKDLWQAFGDVSNQIPDGRTLEKVMENWIEKPGYPVVNVHFHDGKVSLEQKRFLLNQTEKSDTRWDIPISYTTSSSDRKDFSNKSPKLWMLGTELGVIDINLTLTSSDWIILNIGESAYYRVNYEEELWNNLEIALKKENFDGIEEINRAQIVDDAFNLARAKYISYSTALNVTSYLENEIEYFPWYSAFTAFSFLMRRIGEDAELGPYIKEHILKLSNNLYKNISFEDAKENEHIYSFKQELALRWACNLGNEECIKESEKLFKNYKENLVKIHPNLRSTVYCTALRHSKNLSDWNFLWKKFEEETVSAEQVTILTALGCTQDKEKLNEYLKKSIDPNSKIRKQDARYVFNSVYTGNPIGVEVAFDFLRQNHTEIVEHYGGMGDLRNLITGIAERFTSETQINDLQKFYDENKEELKEALNAVNTAIENAKANVEWTESYRKEFQTWFTKGSSSITVANIPVLVAAVIFALHYTIL